MTYQKAACISCVYWEPGGVKGRCHRRAPVPAASNQQAIWPVTDRDDWCGEYAEAPREQPAPQGIPAGVIPA